MDWMMNRQRVDRHTKPQMVRPLGKRPQHNIRCREKRKTRLTVDLRDPEAPKAETVGQLRLLQEFIQTNMRRSSRRTLNLSKKTEFHRSNVSFSSDRERGNLTRSVDLTVRAAALAADL